MAHDGSLASKVEVWIRDTLRALEAFTDRNVDVFEGSTSPSGDALAAEIMAGRASPTVVVLFEGDVAVPLQEGQQAYDPTYGIYVAVKNERPGVARIGETIDETVTYGTNGLRDLLRNALHDKSPNLGANEFYAERSEFRGVQLVWQSKDVFVLRAEVVVRETVAAA